MSLPRPTRYDLQAAAVVLSMFGYALLLALQAALIAGCDLPSGGSSAGPGSRAPEVFVDDPELAAQSARAREYVHAVTFRGELTLARDVHVRWGSKQACIEGACYQASYTNGRSIFMRPALSGQPRFLFLELVHEWKHVYILQHGGPATHPDTWRGYTMDWAGVNA